MTFCCPWCRRSPAAVVGAGPLGPLLPPRQATAKRQPSRRLVPADMLRSEEGGLSDIEKADVAGGLLQPYDVTCEEDKTSLKQLMPLSCRKQQLVLITKGAAA